MRILYVHNYYKLAGGEDVVVEQEMELLREYGHEVFFYSRNNKEIDSMSRWKKCLLPFSSIFCLRTYREVKKMIKKSNIEIMHIHNTLPLISPSIYYVGVSCNIPVIQTLHNFRMQCANGLLYQDGKICEQCMNESSLCAIKKKCYRDSFAETLLNVLIVKIHSILGIYRKVFFICLTEFNKNKLKDNNAKVHNVDMEKVFVKPNFCNPIDYNENMRRKQNTFLYVGRLEESKGINLIIRAFVEMPDKTLIVVGTGTQEKPLKEFIEKKKVKNVQILGFKNREELVRIRQNIKAVIVPSEWYEPFGLVIIEAYAQGVPVIGYELGNVRELIEEGKTGVKYKSNSIESIKEAIERLNGLDEKELIANINRVYQEKYLPSENYKLIIEIYNKVIKRYTNYYREKI